MNDEINDDGFFSERSYFAANQLAGVLGPIFQSLLVKQVPDWQRAEGAIAERQFLSMMFGDNPPPYVVSRLAGFFCLVPLVSMNVIDPAKWAACIEEICDVFPAYYAAVLKEAHPEYTSEEAETIAYLRYSGRKTAA